MQQTKRILSERSDEIDKYFDYLASIENKADQTVYKILKSNILLMLYNCVEAVISNSIDAIRKNIHLDSSANFDCLKREIKIQILKDLKQNISPDKFVESCTKISKSIINLSFKRKNLVKGNIDRDIIKSLASTYGFDVQSSEYAYTKHGETLKTIKDKRNDLAHGTYSFAEIGKDYTIPDLEELKTKTINYLQFVVDEIEKYVRDKKYIESN